MAASDPWNTQIVDSFEGLVSVVRPLMPSVSTDDHLYWFRGQHNAEWKLHSSFSRLLVSSQLSTEEIVRLEQFALREFRSKAHFFVNPVLLGKVKTTPCWWSLMQHHGAPTRLLDWSTSPYVAAYFAVSDSSSDGDGAVWCFCSTTLLDQFVREYRVRPPLFEEEEAPHWYDERLDEFRDRDAILPLSFSYASSERVLAQQGKFTMSFAPCRDHGSLVENIGAPFLKKIVIPKERKSQFLLRLRDINITAASLFPGVDGLGRSIEELISLGPVYGRATRIQGGRAGDVPSNSWCTLQSNSDTLTNQGAATPGPYAGKGGGDAKERPS